MTGLCARFGCLVILGMDASTSKRMLTRTSPSDERLKRSVERTSEATRATAFRSAADSLLHLLTP
jgi:hypothetical protein